MTSTKTSGIVPGTVTAWSDRGFGFVKTTTGVDVFVHVSRAPNRDPLPIGARVRLQYEDVGRGPRARWIEVLPA